MFLDCRATQSTEDDQGQWKIKKSLVQNIFQKTEIKDRILRKKQDSGKEEEEEPGVK